jgi:hypothetical protein
MCLAQGLVDGGSISGKRRRDPSALSCLFLYKCHFWSAKVRHWSVWIPLSKAPSELVLAI